MVGALKKNLNKIVTLQESSEFITH